MTPAVDRQTLRVHGIVFTSFRHFVASRHGDERAAELWAGEPPYLITQAYGDDAFLALFGRVTAAVDADPDALLREFGCFAAERTFRMLYPSYYDEAAATRPFLLGIEERIHELVRATVPEAMPPQLAVEPLDEDGVRIEYRSPRRLCVLLEGLVEGSARSFGETAELRQVMCMRRGDEACVYEASFARA